MALRNATPLMLKPKGVSDTIDGTNAFPGAMSALQNLIPNPSTDDTFVPRPASVQLTAFAGFNTPGFISCLLVVGNIAYGMIASAKNAGKDEPFAYNLLTNAFETITGVLSTNVPTSPATSGDWTPPIMSVVNSIIVCTHPGFTGAGGQFFGWLDITGFTDATKTGTTHSNTSIDTLSANVLTAGWTVGMTITGLNIPANTYIVSIASNGLSIVISNAAGDSVALKPLTVAGGTATQPLWAAGNTNGTALTAVPVSVAQFNGRAYYAVGNGEVFSDSGNALQVTSATQAIAHANGIAVTALGALPLSSPVTGGIVQAIVAFQKNFAIQIITGDASISAGTPGALLVNVLRAGTGTLAPLSITSFELGLAFISPEGMRYIDYNARVSEPVGDHGKGVSVPFIFALSPSRISAAANADTIRISVQNGNAAGQPTQEYWFDLTRKAWSGPHTFPSDQIEAWGATFLISATGITNKLWQSDAEPSNSSTYTENGTVLSFIYQPVLFPDNQRMSMNQITESTLAANLPNGSSLTVIAQDEVGNTLDQILLPGSTQPATIWNAFNWGQANWFGGAGVFIQRRMDWHIPLVFKQGTMRVTGVSIGGVVVGNLYLKYQEAHYLLETTS